MSFDIAIASKNSAKASQYWLKTLSGDISFVSLATNVIRDQHSDDVKSDTFKVPDSLSKKLLKIVNSDYTLLYIFLLSVYKILLYKHCSGQDIIASSPVFRTDSKVNNEFLPYRVILSESDTFKTIITKVKEAVLSAARYQFYPLEKIFALIDQTNPSDFLKNIILLEPLHGPLFDENHSVFSPCEIAVSFQVENEKIVGNITYNTSRFQLKDIKKRSQEFLSILQQVVQDFDIPLCDITIISESEQKIVLNAFNQPVKDIHPGFLHHEFEKRAHIRPHDIAVICDTDKITYFDLNKKANQFAHILRDRGFCGNNPVGLLYDKSIDMVIAILAILKAGGAYVPIDPASPKKRIEFICKDADFDFIMLQQKYGKLIPAKIKQINIDMIDSDFDANNPDQDVSNESIANIIYTSGSTGQPKGVKVTHKGLLNFILWRIREYCFSPQDVTLQLLSVAFDGFGTNLYSSLLSGGILVLPDDQQLGNYTYLQELVNENRITNTSIVPTMFKAILQNTSPEVWKCLRFVVFGGEKTDPDLLALCKKINENLLIINEYGPTENSITSTAYKGLKPHECHIIGKPIPNIKVFITLQDGCLAPIGTPGEIWVSGVGLAQGYLNRPELDLESFFLDRLGNRVYKTGDIGRWNTDGNIEYLGRLDDQVKIRGHRIELKEIEACLLNHFDIDHCLVDLFVKETPVLVAYYTSRDEFETHELRESLKSFLPDYMIPAFFIRLASFPLTINGKIDRKRLPDPTHSQKSYVAPSTKIEKELAKIWKEIFKVTKISANTNFFEYGGHSLQAFTMLSRVNHVFGTRISFNSFLDNPALADLAQLVQSQTVEYSPIDTAPQKEYYPLSFAQQRIFTLHQLAPSSIHYNMPVCYAVKGELDRDQFFNAIQILIDRHDMLRAYFEVENGRPIQKILSHVQIKTKYFEIENSQKCRFEKEFIRPFKLSDAPLFRVALVKIRETDQTNIYMDFHHLIADGFSVKIISKELIQLLHKQALSDVPKSYKDYVAWQFQQDFSDQKCYWQQRFAEPVGMFEIPLQYPRQSVQTFKGDHVHVPLDETLCHDIKRFAKTHQLSHHQFFFAAYFLFLYRYTNQNQPIIGMPVMGRPHPDLNSTVGMFVNTIPVQCNIAPQESCLDFFARFKEQFLNDIKHQHYPLERLLKDLEIETSPDRNPLFNIMFDFQRHDDYLVRKDDGKFSIHPHILDMKVSKFDQSITIIENQKFDCYVQYATLLYDREFILKLATNFEYFLTNLVKDSTNRVCDISFIHQDEKKQLFQFNPKKGTKPSKTLVDLFLDQVKRNPTQTALMYKEEKLTYAELNEKTDNLAKNLITNNVSNNDIVALSTFRSMEMIIGILGILKVGAAFLPIDPSTPLKRKEFYLKKSNAKLLLTNINKSSHNLSVKELLIQEICNTRAKISVKERFPNPDSLAYLIFTSGSTGQPKGVLIQQKNIVSCIQAYNDIFHINTRDRILQTSAFTFDASVEEMFGALCHGATLVLCDENDIKSISKLVNLINDKKITIFTGVPALMSNLNSLPPLNSVRLFICGADVLHYHHISNLLSYAPVYNLYGPTEATVFCTFKKCFSGMNPRIPIGRPAKNSSIYILDHEKKLLPIGVPGEIYIGGCGVAKGYLDDAELTNEKFIFHPEFGNERFYRSGDIGLWLSNGDILFLERIDQQVKIRGFRLELGEIEKHLCKLKYIDNAAIKVFQQHEQDAYLVAYYTGEKQSVQVLMEHMAEYLPDFMIPGRFIHLDKLPVNKNGKIDKSRLIEPKIEPTDKISARPRNEIEEKIHSLWQKLLEREQIGIDENFFSLGGQSLKAIQMAFEIDKEFGIEINLAKIFHHLTIAQLAKLVERSKPLPPIKAYRNKDCYRLSSSQKRIYALENIESNSLRYHIPIAYRLGNVSLARLKDAFIQLIKRHAILRTFFQIENHYPVQKITNDIECDFVISTGDSFNVQKEMSEFIKPFELDSPPLFRVKVYTETKSGDSFLLLDFHHIIADGISIEIFCRELELIYQQNVLKPLNYRYHDYAEWEHDFLESQEIKKQEDFWMDVFSGDIPKLDLPTDFIRPQIQSFNGARYDVKLEKELLDRVYQYARRQKVSIFNVFLAVLNILLYKYTGKNDFIVGVPFANRRRKEFQDIMGMMVNTLALRNKVPPMQGCDSFVSNVQKNTELAFANQDYPFEKLVEKLSLDRDTSHHPLFDVVLSVLEISSGIEGKKDASLLKEALDFQMPTAKFDITLFVLHSQKEMVLGWEYCTKLFKENTIQLFAQYFVKVLNDLVNKPDQSINEIELLSDTDKATIQNVFNDTRVSYPFDKTCVQLFKDQVAQSADQYAVISDARKCTFAELDHQSDILATRLCSLGVNLNIVGLYIEKCPEMIIAMLGILKAGAAYLPIDTDYPQDRIEYMIRDCACNIVLTRESLLGDLPDDIKVIDLEKLSVDQDDKFSIKNNGAESLAYIMYTSGSTGKPKGVMIEHRNIVRLVKSVDYVQLDKNTRLLQTGAPVFDATTLEIWGPLLNGGQVVLVDKTDILDVEQLKKRITIHRINTMWLTSALFNLVVDQDPDALKGLKWLLVGGDVVSPKHVQKIKKAIPNLQIINGYGPTENCVFSTTFPITEPIKNPIPIGKPINNSRAYIVDEFDHLQPIAVSGELLVGGDGVGRGYLNQPELTAEKFQADPFLAGHRVYRTGDITKWDRLGNIEFLGRKDNQIKLHGFRIECGEIEKVIIKHTPINQCLVMVKKISDSKILCCYYVASHELNSEKIRSLLRKFLPDYMIPGPFLHIKEFPLTVNGKIDRKVLQTPKILYNEDNREAPPQNDIQKDLVNIWQEIMHKRSISINDNFFKLGGDSIKAIQVVSKLREKGYQLSVSDIFQHSTIKELSTVIRFCSKPLVQFYLHKNVPFSPIQVWFFQQDFKFPQYFNQSILLSTNSIDYDSTKKALYALIKHHDSLCMVLSRNKKSMIYRDEIYPDLKVIDKRGEQKSRSFQKELNDLQSDIDLYHGPLFKVAIINSDKNDYIFLTIHHLVVDSISWSILIADFVNLYEKFKSNKPSQLVAKTHSYGQWAKALWENEQFIKEKSYWLNVCAGPLVKLPSMNKSANCDRQLKKKIICDKKQTREIQCTIHSAFGTDVQQILLTALGMTLFTMVGKGNIITSLEGHGREELNMNLDVSRTVGWFTSLYPLKIHLDDRGMEEWIILIKDMIHKIPQKGIGYGLLRYSENVEPSDLNNLKVEPEISFNYLGEALSSKKMGEFKVSHINPGRQIHDQNRMPAKIEISAMIFDEKLHMNFCSYKRRVDIVFFNQFVFHYQRYLNEITEFCRNRNERTYTPSDFDKDDLSIEDLNEIMDEYN